MSTLRATARLSAAALVVGCVASFAACQHQSAPVTSPTPTPSDPTSGASSAQPAPPSAAAAKKRSGPIPERHRAEAIACSTETVHGDVEPRPGIAAPHDAGGGDCKKDADCTAGKNGRCAMSGGGRMRPVPRCIYDACFADADCGSKSECKCGGAPGRGNACIAGNCATDDDCGDGYCSPSYGTSCGAYGGYVGNYCHGRADECTNDAECTKSGDSGYCAWSPEVGHWKCGYSHCVG